MRVSPVSAFDAQNVPPEGLIAFSLSRAALREAVETRAGKTKRPRSKRVAAEVDQLIAALRSEALGSDELIIAAWPRGDDALRDRMEKLAAALTPDEIPQPAELLQARRNAVMRRELLSRYGYYTAEELADMHGSTAKNRYALATRWTREGRVFSVPLGARSVFPAFQFDADGQPYPIVARVRAELPREDMSPWGVGLWFHASNAWLPGEARPAELLGGPEQELVVAAARRLSEPEPL